MPGLYSENTLRLRPKDNYELKNEKVFSTFVKIHHEGKLID